MATTTRPHLTITSFPSIPLTTTFTRPSDCGGISVTNVYIIDNKPSCLPDDFAGTVGDFSSFFYSPGIACPEGYWTACHDTTGVSSITTVTCCPTYGPGLSLSCVADPRTLSERWTSLFCTWIAPASGTDITVTASDTAGRTSTVTRHVVSPGGVNAFGVRMVYQASDMERTTTTTTTTTTSSSHTAATRTSASDDDGAPTARPTSPTTANPTDDPSSSSPSGLSTAEQAAIGVSVTLGAVLALVIAYLLWRWRRRRILRQQQQQPQQQYPLMQIHHHTHHHRDLVRLSPVLRRRLKWPGVIMVIPRIGMGSPQVPQRRARVSTLGFRPLPARVSSFICTSTSL
ncbi:hypothetical protein VTJ49DRAFT_5608 [Mycothermus thermophilus]|uniref:Uncharacterized protein n=1 Tax=Humicola insolens TaxID=85995 RepID=A0ABR3V2T9_HUMIN